MSRLILSAFFLFASATAHAGPESAFVDALKKSGFDCTDDTKNKGVVCVGDNSLYVLVPKNLPKLRRLVFYAHGDFGPCDKYPGLTGENFLKDQMPALLRNGAIAVLPKRVSRDLSYPLHGLVDRMERIFSINGVVPWTMAGHSYGGKFIPQKLLQSPELLGRVDQVMLLDAGYDVGVYTDVWKKILAKKSSLKIRSFSSTTSANSEKMQNSVNESYPGAMTNQTYQGVSHCEMPAYFREL